MYPLPDDIAAAVLAQFAASAEVRTAVPGGMWLGRADEPAALPYGVFQVEAVGTPRYLSDGTTLQSWAVRASVYTAVGATGHSPRDVQQALAAAVPRVGWAELPTGRVLHCLPQAPDGKFDPKPQAGRDVYVTGGQWLLTTTGGPAA